MFYWPVVVETLKTINKKKV